MELGLKHLAAYLPYNLKFYDGINIHILDEENLSGVVCDIKHLSIIKPILRPLSDLTKEIEHNGEKFVPIEHIEVVMLGQWSDSCEDYVDAILDDLSNVDVLINKCPYDILQLLLEWHFDVFSLIEKGLAIDINQINK